MSQEAQAASTRGRGRETDLQPAVPSPVSIKLPNVHWFRPNKGVAGFCFRLFTAGTRN